MALSVRALLSGRIINFKTPLTIPIFAYIAVTAISLIVTIFHSPPAIALAQTMKYRGSELRGIIQLFLLVFFASTYFLTVYFCSDKKRLFTVLKVYTGVALIVSLYGIYQFFGICYNLQFVDITTAISTGGGGRGVSYYTSPALFRAHATFQEPAIFGHYLLSVIPFLIAIYLYRDRVKAVTDHPHELLYSKLMPLIIMLIALLLTKGAGALIGFFGAFLFLVVFARGIKYKLKAVSMLTAMVIIIGILIVLSLHDYERILHLITCQRLTSLRIRLCFYAYILELWRQYPILGVGIGNYGFYSAQFFGGSVLGSAHGVPWQSLAETGLIGFSTFSFLILSYYRMMFRALRKAKDTLWYPYILGYLASFTGMMIQSFSFGDRLNMYVWFFVGISVATVRLIQREQKA